MTPVSNNNDPHQPPKANLEELFRQKFAEAELQPRADVWDRLDHELLVRENQGYRRRLVGYRRLAVAACAVATLGVGGWLTQHVAGPGTAPDLAAVDTSAAAQDAATRLGAAGQPLTGARRTATSGNTTTTNAAGNTASGTTTRNAAGAATSQSAVAANAVPRTAAGATSSAGSMLDQLRSSFGGAGHTATSGRSGTSLAGRALAAIKQTFGSPAASGAGVVPAGLKPGGRSFPGNVGSNGSSGVSGLATLGSEGAEAAAGRAWTLDALQPVNSRLRRTGNSDSLKKAVLSAPVMMAAQTMSDEDKEEKKNASVSRWRWRGGYSAERFVPNVSSVAGTGVALRGITTTYAANGNRSAAEQTKLQPGLAQRGQFGAAVPLGKKHWTLLTGAELTVISGNTGREVVQNFNSLNPSADEKLQTGRYHLTTIGVPVQMRYEGRKQGWGVYAAVGAAVNVLLRNRTAVGVQSTTDDASYRRVLASVRSSAGVRYSPAGGQWQLNVGPEAEAGLTTLNANPSESWGQRTRPYAVGLSASVEFGGGKTELVP